MLTHSHIVHYLLTMKSHGTMDYNGGISDRSSKLKELLSMKHLGTAQTYKRV
jgi:hypothetical protein